MSDFRPREKKGRRKHQITILASYLYTHITSKDYTFKESKVRPCKKHVVCIKMAYKQLHIHFMDSTIMKERSIWSVLHSILFLTCALVYINQI